MKWILAILCGLALQAGAITNGVFATKSPYVVESATMPYSLWTNSVLWLTAESPVLNAGTTNAQWICYAKTCSGNAVQLDPNKQPLRVFTNGFWGLGFDGADDLIEQAVLPNVSNITLFAKVRMLDTDTTNNIGRQIIGNQAGNFDIPGVGLVKRGTINYNGLFFRAGTSSGGFDTVAPVGTFTNLWNGSVHSVAATVETTTTNRIARLYIDGVNVSMSSSTNVAPFYSATAKTTLGRYVGGTGSSYNGDIIDAKIFQYTLTSNEVWRLSR